MANPTLAEIAAAQEPVRKILADKNLGHVAAAQLLQDQHGIRTTESGVRRWRLAESNGHHGRAASQQAKEAVPKGWEPYAEEAGKIGSAIVRLPRPGATEHDLLVGAGFDPDSWKIRGAVNTRRWMRYDQEWLYYYKFDVVQGESEASIEAHVEDLVKQIRRRVAPAAKAPAKDGLTYVLVLSDWQIGKREGNKGTVDTVGRYRDCLAQTVQNIRGLRRMGVNVDRLALLSVGDLVEGCGDHYDMQTFSVDLDRRGQNKVVRELITQTILTLSPMFADTTIVVIGGNHGENRKDGKAYTTFADNDDVGCPEAVKEAFDLAGWDNLTWHIPDDELSLCVDVNGVKIGVVHGHQFKGGVNALKKAEDWWRSNVFGLEPVNEAQILLSGHFHHYCAVNVTAGRTWIQAPTIDPGSKWYTDSSGVTATPGVLTFVVDPSNPFGYDLARVLIPSDSDLTS